MGVMCGMSLIGSLVKFSIRLHFWRWGYIGNIDGENGVQ
jgi:hypothetical protein